MLKARRSFLSLITIMTPGCVGPALPTLPRTARYPMCPAHTQIPGNGNVYKLTSEKCLTHATNRFGVCKSRMMTKLISIILGDAKWVGATDGMEVRLLNCCSMA